MQLATVLVAILLALSEADECYRYTLPSLQQHFHNESKVALECIAAGAVGGGDMVLPCNNDCLHEFVAERMSKCFTSLEEQGFECGNLLSRIFDVLRRNKVPLPGCSSQSNIAVICRSHPAPNTKILGDMIPWMMIVSVAAGSAVFLAALLGCLWWMVSKMNLGGDNSAGYESHSEEMAEGPVKFNNTVHPQGSFPSPHFRETLEKGI
jgi:hypothetical protein|uniref:FZ domain-containing protein n=1 Tax=Eutreptiella gymnastica TaxID=73025 RepID=A0A7S4G788_9EUGL|mmetsp:Transcript_83364/g.139100  ORF Transcript_83364/g.139100 Transcript_83364/m.139100 type:complete len:208 (-) Transcript_83364:651-1274(-)|eukprot:CAMPEP_0174303594 /NCGR_PEP_ID=MMETSP0809-20121228/60279_1 /TAXON_ID=73025 ORGANISM="Eutreptiella gymnastica-like, Strain CCMP1594" /NCGR_SAMPLE_ID=MMETSP0809 /ASSEMBLY_ACC=CAM_ASM_000658 /LENGTH=207 /DNA_ID=CAMNT_0015409647 /DNA_START=29 /DNA_END=652 /DNA_ORIENTATION=+